MTGSDDPGFNRLWMQLAQPLDPAFVAEAYDTLYTSIIRTRWRPPPAVGSSAQVIWLEQRIDMTLAA